MRLLYYPALPTIGTSRPYHILPLVAFSLFAFVVIVGLVEVVGRRPIEPSKPGNRLADGGGKIIPPPMTEFVAPVVPDVRTETGIDIQAFEPSGFYARAIERDPDVFITTPAVLPADFRGDGRSRVVVEYLTRDQLMTELAMSGLDSAVVCSDRDCRLFVGRQESRPMNADSQTRNRGI